MKITKQEWNDSQSHEAKYWRGQANGGEEQYHRWGWYTKVCFPLYFRKKRFDGLSVADVGSGPRGVLHWISAAKKMAIDPLMAQFIADGHRVDDNGVNVATCRIEEVGTIFPASFDVVFCLNCLDHCQDPAKGIEQLVAMLKPGGELVICVDMRHPDDLDHLHKIRITSSFMRGELQRNKLSFEAWHVPHQAPTRTVQFCAVGREDGQ